MNKEDTNLFKLFLKLKTEDLQGDDLTLCINKDLKGIQYYRKKDLLNKKYLSYFLYDEILTNQNDCKQVFEKVAKEHVDESIKEKKDYLLFGFGNTNSGKTHSIVGNCHRPGILPLMIEYLLEQKENFQIRFAAFEIYNEDVYDLLKKDKKFRPIKLKKGVMSTGQVLERLVFKQINTLKEFKKIFKLSQKRKTMGENFINKNSSRSHCLYRVELNFNQGKKVNLIMIDLAGVERNVSGKEISTKQMSESKNINLSLSTLLRCFRALKQNQMLPYRESNLTKIIFESMEKNVQIGFLITFDPNHEHFEDNMRVLEFSSIAKNLQYQVLKSNAQFQNIKERQILVQQSNSFSRPVHLKQPLSEEVSHYLLNFHDQLDQCSKMIKTVNFSNRMDNLKMMLVQANKENLQEYQFVKDLREQFKPKNKVISTQERQKVFMRFETKDNNYNKNIDLEKMFLKNNAFFRQSSKYN